jgi:cysteine desulfurase / selenocysteine lyase
MNHIYFDNAATSWPKPPGMIEAMTRYNENIGANPGRSGHRLSIEAARTIYEAREAMAELIGAPDPLSVIFTKNGTEAINCALFGLLKPGDHVIASSMEHNSVMRPLRFLEQQGVKLSFAPCSPAGEIDPGDVKKMIGRTTRAIVATHASNVTGTVFPMEALGRIGREENVLLVVDAAQTAGNIPFDVVKMDVDILCFTGHKSLLGPQGTGGFYVRKGVEERLTPLMRGGTGSASEHEEQPDFLPDKFESGTPNGIGLAGLCAGVRFVMDMGVDRIREKEASLTRQFTEGLRGIEGVTIYGSHDTREHTSVVSFSVRGASSSDIAFALDEQFGIMCRPGLHCAPAAHRTIGTFPQGTVRFGFGVFNTEAEVEQGVEAVAHLAEVYRGK